MHIQIYVYFYVSIFIFCHIAKYKSNSTEKYGDVRTFVALEVNLGMDVLYHMLKCLQFLEAGGVEPLVALLNSFNEDARRSGSWAISIVSVDEAIAAEVCKNG